MNPEGKDNIVRLYQSGLTMKAVALQLYVSETWVRKVLVERGITARRRNWIVDPSMRAEIAKAYVAGATSAALAQTYKTSPRTIARWVRESGCKAHRIPAKGLKVTPAVRAEVMAARGKEAGHKLAARLGLHASTIYKLWNERAHGLGMGR